MGKEIVTLDSISLEIAKLFRLERKIVELSVSIKADLAAKEKLKKQFNIDIKEEIIIYK